MSSIAMAADSTQSELMRHRKNKAKLARRSDKSRKQHVTGYSKMQKTYNKQVTFLVLSQSYYHTV